MRLLTDSDAYAIVVARMSARQEAKTSESLKGLPKAVADAPHPVMKRLGEIALRYGFSQESLAKALSDRYSVTINGANVSAHFASKNPQRQTIERYAQVLGLAQEHLHVIEHGKLSAAALQQWEREVFHAFAVSEHRWKAGTIKAVRKTFESNPEARERALTAASWSWGSFRRIPEFWHVPQELQAFAAALYPTLDLRGYVRQRSPGDGLLFSIYANLLQLYGDERKDKVLAFVDACAAILKVDGFDTRPMYEDFHAMLRGTQASLKGAQRKGKKQ